MRELYRRELNCQIIHALSWRAAWPIPVIQMED
jgi:hypothetical protein